jgi:hypothetical protein
VTDGPAGEQTPPAGARRRSLRAAFGKHAAAPPEPVREAVPDPPEVAEPAVAQHDAAPAGVGGAVGTAEAAASASTRPAEGPVQIELRAAVEGMVRGVNIALLGRESVVEDTVAAQTDMMLAHLAHHDLSSVTASLVNTLLGSDMARLRLGLDGTTQARMPPDFTDPPAVRFAAIVRGCYVALLGREPVEIEIERWWEEKQNSFLQHGTAAITVQMIHHVVHSAEWNHRFRVNQMHLVRTELLPMPRGTGGVAVYLSLGATGYTAAMLRRFHRRRWSGPFDWISATPAVLRDMIDDDFEQLLDPASYAAVPLEQRPDTRFFRCRHLGYEARHGAPCVLHAADMTEAAGQAYMARCVQRFRTSMRGLPSKLVLQVVPEPGDPVREFELTAHALERYGRNFRFVMVSVLPEAAQSPFPEIEPTLAIGVHRLLRMRTLSPIEGTDPGDMLDEVVLLRGAFAAAGVGP